MKNPERNSIYEDLITDRKENYYLGNNHYYILKTTEKSTTYVSSNEKIFDIYSYTNQHNTFLEMLPKITDGFAKLEDSLKKYYNYAQNESYDSTSATNQLNTIYVHIKELHPFFTHSSISLSYIGHALFQYCSKTWEYRFYIYLRNNNILPPDLQKYRDNDLTKLERNAYHNFRQQHKNSLHQAFKKFLSYEQAFLEKLFLPIYELLFSDSANEFIQKKMQNFWLFYSKNIIPKNDTDTSFNIYFFKDEINRLIEKYNSQYILFRLKTIADVFTDYFSVFSNLLSLYKDTKVVQQYALLLTNNPRFYRLIDTCKVYSPHQTMHKIAKYYFMQYYKFETERNNCPSFVLSDDEIATFLTDNIYAYIKDCIDSSSPAKDYITKTLPKCYPTTLESYNGCQLIGFQDFEQLLAIELLDIIQENCLIKKCPFCDCYFTTKSKKQKYCNEHKNQHKIHQNSYSDKKTHSRSEYQQICDHYLTCFYKRARRDKSLQKNFNKLKYEAITLVNQTKLSTSLETFTNKLNSLSEENAFSPPRKYHKKA
ncbi:MAG: hypothetical protein J6A92_04440 [Lachnospiraceae bacterium]|nr:hypothetical protein [Lachnospiraceae bacterium]